MFVRQVGHLVSLADRLALPPVPTVEPRPTPHPKGWEPGTVWESDRAAAITTPAISTIDPSDGWDEVLIAAGLDPVKWVVIPPVVVSHDPAAWHRDETHDSRGLKMPAVTRPLTRYRLRVALRPTQFDRADVNRLIEQIGRRKSTKAATVAPDTTDRALVVCLSDWQMGKGEGGGSVATVARIEAALAELPRVIKRIKPSAVYLVGMGDLVEQCSGHYASQPFTTDLDRREQMRVVRRLILSAVETVAPLVSRVVLGAVPGNHGENRGAGGKAYTTITDNDDLAVVEQVAEILAANPGRYGHVSVVLADSLTLTLDVCGVIHSWTHGHQNLKGSAKVEGWWKGQALGRTGIADSDILATAHFHHLLVSEASGRTHFQCPAMDGGSQYHTDHTGQSSPPGLLTYGVGLAYGPRKWGDLEVIGGN